jgi:trimeric autotransporter adhesin
MTQRAKLSISILSLAVSLLTGCSTKPAQPVMTPGLTGNISGGVHGGQQPISNAVIQLYTVGTSGDGSSATPLLTQIVKTDQNGNFSLSPGGVPLYSCTSATMVYVTAIVGDPSPGISNPNIAQMTALGPCTALTTGTFIWVNEVTTVAAVSALAPYMTSFSAIGSATGDAAALSSAFTLATQLANTSTGTSPGSNIPAGMIVPSTQIYTLADILANCVNSAGGTAGDGSGCGTLFSLTTPGSTAPTDTVAALLNLANNPTLNTQQLFNTVSGTVPFQPTLTVTPPSFQTQLLPSTSAGYPLQITPASNDFGTVVVGTTTAYTQFTVLNTGAAAVTVHTPVMVGADAADYMTYGCGSVVNPGSSCIFYVAFQPSTVGARPAYVELDSTARFSPQFIPVYGTGTAQTFNASTLSFTIGGTIQDLTVTNFASTPITISSVNYADTGTGTNNFAVVGNTCGSLLAAESVCTISVVSLATSGDRYGNAVTYTGTLTITDSAQANPQVISLTSTNMSYFSGGFVEGSEAFAAEQLGVSEAGSTTVYSPYNFYSGTQPPAFAMGGTNPGDFAFTVSQNGSPGCDVSPPESAASQLCSYTFTFTPTVAGARSAHASLGGGQYLLLTGTGVGPGPFIRANPASLSFAVALPDTVDPNSGSTTTLTMTNIGTTTYGFASMFTGANPSLLTVDGSSCPSLAPQATCTVTVTFTGTTIGTYTANLVLKDTNSTFSVSVPIAVNAIYWPASPFPQSITFPAQALGTTSAAKTFNIGDLNDYPLDHAFSVVLPSSSNFVLPEGSTCVASTSLCTLSVAFAPHVTGLISETAVVTDQVTGLTSHLYLYGSGGAPVVSLSPSPLVFPNRAVGTTSVPDNIILTNTGTLALTVNAVSLVGAVNNNFTETNNCTSVAPNTTCTIAVTFAPTGAGPQSAMIHVVSNAASSPDTVGVSGTAQ